jgi:lysophospholipase L1-like esterase
MKDFFDEIKKMPLFGIIIVTSVLLTIAAAVGTVRSVYSVQGMDLVKQPLLSVVFNGIHDGVKPWQAFAGQVQPQDDGVDAILDGSAGASGQEAAGGGVSGAAGAAVTTDPAGIPSESISGMAASASGTAVSGAAGDGAQASASGMSGGSGSAADSASQAEIAEKTAKSPSYVHADTMPDGVCNPVVPAVDYGNADRRFMDADGTAYNTDTTGTFAQNGDYYKLQTVTDDYFADALFIGDSRTDGLHDYGNMKGKTSFMAKDSLSVFSMWDKTLPYWLADGTSGQDSIGNILGKQKFAKVYLCVGVNELGMPTTTNYYQKYRESVEAIRKLQPDAIIFIEGMMHVSKKETQSSGVYNNTNIVQRNQAVATLANGHDIFYIDMNSAVCDTDGNIPDDQSNDGIHLKASGYEQWHQFLLQNGIIRDTATDRGVPADTAGGTAAGTTAGNAADGSSASGTTAGNAAGGN